MNTTAPGLAGLVLLALATSGAHAQDGATQAFVGGTVWQGTDAEPIADAVLLVRAGRIDAVAPSGEIDVPEDAEVVDLDGRWIVPGLINTHGHVGSALGLEQGPQAQTRENILDQLALNARYGITTVVSLGAPGYEGVAVRNENDHPDLDRSRLYVAGAVINAGSPEQASAEVQERVDRGVDWVKFRIDDFLGRAEKMDPETYGAIVEAAHEHGLPVAGHIVYLEDAKGLAEAGAEIVAHSVRDAAVDDELIASMQEGGICLQPTLTRELSTFVYAERPDFFDDPFFLRDADPEVVSALESPERQAGYRGASAEFYREALPIAEDNMMALHGAGIRIVFSTDSGMPGRFQGYFEHLELEMMQNAGMTPRDILLSATSVAADCMRLNDLGTLETDAWADFLVLRADPFEDIRNLRQIADVRIAGNPVPGAAFDGQ